MINNFRRSVFWSVLFVAFIFVLHAFFSYFINDLEAIRFFRPVRDILFFPFMVIVENIREIYCFIGKIGFLDYNRCIAPVGGSIKISEGPSFSFQIFMTIIGLSFLLVWYIFIFKIIFYLLNKFKS